jgi:hypothetical protein
MTQATNPVIEGLAEFIAKGQRSFLPLNKGHGIDKWLRIASAGSEIPERPGLERDRHL